MLRLLKAVRRFETMQILLRAFRHVIAAMPVCTFTFCFIILVFTALIYAVEPRDNIPSLSRALWLTVITATTVGYGDETPQTKAGRLVVGVLVYCMLLYMAFPIGIIGSEFSEVWKDRDRILLMQKTHDHLVQWGYTASDIPRLFDLMNADSDGELNLEQFCSLITQMKIGLNKERIVQLFDWFDFDDSGTVSAREFVRILFPTEYHELYLQNKTASASVVSNQEKRYSSNTESSGLTSQVSYTGLTSASDINSGDADSEPGGDVLR